jgi:iron complex outermembrane receptor protein
MAVVRSAVSTLAALLLCVAPLGAQATGVIRGRVVDSASSQGLVNASVVIEGTQRGALTDNDGSFTLTAPSGEQRVRVRRIGFSLKTAAVSVPAGGTVNLEIKLVAQSTVLSEVVVTGYGSQRREAITGSVTTVEADDANKGVVTNATQLVQGRVTGVQMVQNNGEPGAGAQIRIRGGTSISASNDPLYVVDGVPLQNESTTPGAAGIGSINPALPRNPLNAINPNDIESITVLKDASATAIYGSRGANGVVLIQTKRGATGNVSEMEYETYVGAATLAKSLDLMTGDQYRAFVNSNLDVLGANAAAGLGTANTDWEKELTHTALATNHNLAFSGGSGQTHYRASLNYFDQQGVVTANGLKRYQGRLNADHYALDQRLRLGLNLMASRVDNKFSPNENTGGFLGGLFTNMVIFNPTFPVRRTDGTFFESGCAVTAATCTPTAQDVRNPVAMANQLQDNAPETRLLGNFNATLELFEGLSAQTTLGLDNSDSERRSYAPRSSAVGAAYNGYARRAQRSLENLNFQQLLTYTPRLSANQEFEIVGGYEYTKTDNQGFDAQSEGFITDVFGVDNLAAGTQASSPVPTSYHNESQLVSFFSRANYGFAHKYFLTGVLRRDGSSRLAPGHRWTVFPALSGSWRLTETSFMRNAPLGLSSLALRAGWGKQGNQAVEPYQTQLLLRADPGAAYPFGGTIGSGLRAAQVGNPDLKWETATQTNVGFDYGFKSDRITGSVDFYQKNTKDLLLTVNVPQPAVVSTRLENIGSLRNRGLEASADGQLLKGLNKSLSLGLVFTLERNEVTSLGDTSRKFINTGFVSGQGQSNQYSQRIMVGEPIGTFFGPKFIGVVNGKQVFECKSGSAGCVDGKTTDPTDGDKVVIGNANPSFTVGVRNNGMWKHFDASWLWRGEFGGQTFNNTALVYASKSNAKQGRNFLSSALSQPDSIGEPSKYSSRWVEDRTFARLQNVTIGYAVPTKYTAGRVTRMYVSGDNLLLFTKYSGYDPEVFVSSGLASRGIDYLVYPPARRFTLGARVQF